MQALHDEFRKDGLVVLGVNGYDESREVVKDFVDKQDIAYPVLLKGGRVATQQYFVRGFPTRYWIGRDGKVVSLDSGFGPGGGARLRELAQKLLRQ